MLVALILLFSASALAKDSERASNDPAQRFGGLLGLFPGSLGSGQGGFLPGGGVNPGLGGVHPGGLNLGGVYPGGINPGGVYPGGVYPGGVYPGGINPGGVHPGGVHPGGIYPGGVYPPPSHCKNWCRRYDGIYPAGASRARYYCCDRRPATLLRPVGAVGPVVSPLIVNPGPYAGTNTVLPPAPIGTPYHHNKRCPTAQDVCVVTRGVFSPPTECYSDSECNPSDSCCYDTCLRHRVCKTADVVLGSGLGLGLGALGDVGRQGALDTADVATRFDHQHTASSQAEGHVRFNSKLSDSVDTSNKSGSGKIKFQE